MVFCCFFKFWKIRPKVWDILFFLVLKYGHQFQEEKNYQNNNKISKNHKLKEGCGLNLGFTVPTPITRHPGYFLEIFLQYYYIGSVELVRLSCLTPQAPHRPRAPLNDPHQVPCVSYDPQMYDLAQEGRSIRDPSILDWLSIGRYRVEYNQVSNLFVWKK